jgi:peroxiredoxin
VRRRGLDARAEAELTATLSLPDLALPDHTGGERRLSEIAGGDPVALFFSRGWWCPKEQRFLRGLVALQDEFEVAYSKLVVVSIDAPEVQAAFRAGLGARFPFLSDADHRYLDELGLREDTDTVHHPYRPAAFTLYPDLTVHRAYNGYWFWGRPTLEEIRQDMRAISVAIRTDWELS